jgi:hypothetical protein
MTKARDIASAAPAPAGVTSTELGYVDGVTSAIQTQVDAKIAKTLTTTTGDIIYASSANTPARLGIGSTDQVLKVTAGVPAWATPAASGSMTELASGSLSGTALSLTSISGSYKNLILVVRDYYASTSSSPFIRVNGDSTANAYNAVGTNRATAVNTTVGEDGTNWGIIWNTGVAADNNNFATITLLDYANTTSRKLMTSTAAYAVTGYANNIAFLSGAWNNTAAINAISLTLGSGTYSGGTYILYGQN